MLDYNNCIACVNKLLENVNQLVNIGCVKSGGRLVDNAI